MKTSHEKTLDTILQQQDPQSILGTIQNKVLALQQISQVWKKEISADLSQHTRVANFRDRCLVIEIDNATWATRLRYLIPDLINTLLKYPTLKSLKHIEWTIQPHFHPPAKQRYEKPVLSDASATLLRNTARNINVATLQEALLRLSSQ